MDKTMSYEYSSKLVLVPPSFLTPAHVEAPPGTSYTVCVETTLLQPIVPKDFLNHLPYAQTSLCRMLEKVPRPSLPRKTVSVIFYTLLNSQYLMDGMAARRESQPSPNNRILSLAK